MATRKKAKRAKAKRPDEHDPFSIDARNPPAGPACPTCGSADTYVIPYGLDSSGHGHDAIFGNEPRYRCRACAKAWGRLDGLECPACGSARVLPIVWGEPTDETWERARRGEVAIGGCMIWGHGRDHKWECLDCEERFGGKDRPRLSAKEIRELSEAYVDALFGPKPKRKVKRAKARRR